MLLKEKRKGEPLMQKSMLFSYLWIRQILPVSDPHGFLSWSTISSWPGKVLFILEVKHPRLFPATVTPRFEHKIIYWT